MKTIDKIPLSEQLHTGGSSAFMRYAGKAVGSTSLIKIFCYEFSTIFLANIGGSIGYILRKIFTAPLFNTVGAGFILGRGVTLRHPGNINVGHNVAIDDYVLLDASGAGEDKIVISDNVIISRNCVIQGKQGPVYLGKKVDIGVNVVLSSVNAITIEDSVLIAGNCYIGGARYNHSDIEKSMMDQGAYSRGPVRIGEGSWIGAGAVILDGVQLGKRCIVGAGAVVTGDLPDNAVAVGVPAKIMKMCS